LRAVLLQETNACERKNLVGNFQGGAIWRMAEARSVDRAVINRLHDRGAGDETTDRDIFRSSEVSRLVPAEGSLSFFEFPPRTL
jgi:hypothetical protein